jgi:hypothetical protein
MNEVFKRTAFLEVNEYPRDYRECLRQAVHELMTPEDLRDTYNLLGTNYEEFINDMSDSYIRYKHALLREYLKNAQ